MQMQYAIAVVAHEETHRQAPRLPVATLTLPRSEPTAGYPAMPHWPRGLACF